jgi:hypothetical protein
MIYYKLNLLNSKVDMNTIDASKYPKCDCGTDVNSSHSSFTESYSGLGWFFWSMGTTATPKTLTFTCNKCSKKYALVDDKKLIKRYMLFRKK